MKKSKNSIDRRKFVKQTLTGVGGVILAPTILSACAKGANDLVHIAHIGVGSRGTAELRSYFVPLTDSRSVAICDVFQNRRLGGTGLVNKYYKENEITAPECKPYLDFEEILERKDIDAVHITTPDHWHVPAAIKAARAGKHIMLAKPLGLSYPNYMMLDKELKANDVRFHYGTQQRAAQHMKVGIELVKEGAIGEIERVDVWCPSANPVESPVCHEVPVPDTFDFDKWTGPARLNPYCPELVTNNGSWFNNDYSIGFLAGWGAHPLDIMVWALKDQMLGEYTCKGKGAFWAPGGLYNNVNSWDLDYYFKQGLKLHFFSDDVANSKNLYDYRDNKESNGTTFYGSKGWISLSRGSVQSNIPEINTKISEKIIDYIGMGQLFVDICKGKKEEVCPLSDAILSDSISHMGNIAIRTQRKITWDTKLGKVIDDDEANSLFIRAMREPYQV
ncbi:MAG: Gfo/Idh/MocA family oxidoreductase [Bacteroidota bacterium]|nr:Gfo/Idh/MocA family oxidoreductase [Bacteroidota bacterium]